MKKNLLYFFMVSFILISCKKEEDKFEIYLQETTPINLVEFEENILVRISYEHSDGYMGFYDPDRLSLEIKDSRLNNPDYYHLIPINPPNNTLSIQGEILIEIDAPFILGSDIIETLVFDIRIQDREMQWSNTVKTPTITVHKE